MTYMTPLPQRATPDWFRIENSADSSGKSADVYIYEQIGLDWWTGEGVTAKGFASQIATLDVDTIRLHINSPGGLAFDGLTIMNSLRDHKATVEVTVDGLAASAASVIAMAGDKVVMNRGAQMMIHDASTIAYGNAAAMSKAEDLLNKLSDSLADVYAARAGGDRAQWRARMQEETWYTAEEAVQAGLADEWTPAPPENAEKAMARFDLSIFSHAGRAYAPAPPIDAHELPDSSEPGEPNRKENVVTNDDLTAGLRERLGVTDADASTEMLLAALDQALEEQAEPAAPAAAIPEGTTLIDSAVLADLQAKAEQGVTARAQQDNERRQSIVDQAVVDGRIAPSSKATWLASLEKDEESATTLIATLAKNTIPVAEIGHQDSENTADEALFASLFGETKEA